MINKIVMIALVISVIMSVIKMFAQSTYKAINETGVVVKAFKISDTLIKIFGVKYNKIEYKYVLNDKTYYISKLKHIDDLSINKKEDLVKCLKYNPKFSSFDSELYNKIETTRLHIIKYVLLTFLFISIYAYLIF